MEKRTMRAFDEMCLTPVQEMTPEDIREQASQAVVRPLPQRDHEPGEPVGARREAAVGRVVEAVDAGREERPGCGCVMVSTIVVPRRTPGGAPGFGSPRRSMS